MLGQVSALAVAAVAAVKNDGYNRKGQDNANNDACNGAGREALSGLSRGVRRGDSSFRRGLAHDR